MQPSVHALEDRMLCCSAFYDQESSSRTAASRRTTSSTLSDGWRMGFRGIAVQEPTHGDDDEGQHINEGQEGPGKAAEAAPITAGRSWWPAPWQRRRPCTLHLSVPCVPHHSSPPTEDGPVAATQDIRDFSSATIWFRWPAHHGDHRGTCAARLRTRKAD